MLQIKTYIYAPFGPKQAAQKIPIDDIDALKRATPYMDLMKLEGYIDLSYYGTPIMDDSLTDLIFFTWDEMLRAIRSVVETGRGCVGFWWDVKAICLKQTNPRFLLLKVSGKGWLLPKDELLTVLVDGAIQFFQGMFSVFSRYKRDYEACLQLKEWLIRERHI